MSDSHFLTTERRRHLRQAPAARVTAARVAPVLPLTDVEVLNTSPGGVALRTRTPLRAGERLSFTANPVMPPILAEVLTCDRLDDDTFHIRCRCLLGSFEAA